MVRVTRVFGRRIKCTVKGNLDGVTVKFTRVILLQIKKRGMEDWIGLTEGIMLGSGKMDYSMGEAFIKEINS